MEGYSMSEPRKTDTLVSGNPASMAGAVDGKGKTDATDAALGDGETGGTGAPRAAVPPRRILSPQQTLLFSGPPMLVRTATPPHAPVVAQADPSAPVRVVPPSTAVVPDGIGAPATQTTLMRAPAAPSAASAPENDGAVWIRRATPERGAGLERPATLLDSTPRGVPDPQEGRSTRDWVSPSSRSSIVAAGPSVQAMNSALLVRFATQVAGVQGSATGTELVRPIARPVAAGPIPAEAKVEQVVRPENIDADVPMLQRNGAERAAAFRALRRRLEEQGDPAVILVTSAEDSEGKSTCAANLALAMAESARYKVLLVEGNLGRPRLAQLFGYQPSTCLLTQLETHRTQIDAPWATTEIQPSGLHVLAVSSHTDGKYALNGPCFSACVARWRLTFDYVVIDGPAILSSCDASIIHDAVDTVVMVARSGVSRTRTIKRALAQIASRMVAGLVLMDSRS